MSKEQSVLKLQKGMCWDYAWFFTDETEEEMSGCVQVGVLGKLLNVHESHLPQPRE